ncbi:hypothetical protein CAPTEDRAFT_227543 [Capitella teleta]|uniref:Uncharacterized protein n=1 Tax=Capitella teleta TaxID=283909 RepID=R7TCS4_CAPTE|nr:hypothetical protein CAPTEDRAFT_227543 [Capitella teleta]|eukprot:ELT89267.1 hypothetical protein CAPTEDRAFT_227543 [Capitella teleta]
MSTRRLRHGRDSLELLERILNKTSLTTKRVTHGHIIDIGEGLMTKTHVDIDGMRKTAVKEALDAAENRHIRELCAALSRARKEAADDKEKAMTRQKVHYEQLAKRVALQRSKAEEEKIRELTKKFEKEKAEALSQQWIECERLKEEAIEEACEALRKQLRNEFAIEKEMAIAQALSLAREKFRKREQETIERTRKECEALAATEAARVTEIHAQEISMQNERYNILLKKYNKEIDHKQHVESDFHELQTDYQRFMNYTDGKYHSDYMMHLRDHGLNIAKKKVSVVTYEDIQKMS